MDRGAWWAAVYGVTQSQTRLKRLSSSSSSRSRVDSICKGLGERMVSAFLDYAETQTIRKIPLTMEDWKIRLEQFLKLFDHCRSRPRAASLLEV